MSSVMTYNYIPNFEQKVLRNIFTDETMKGLIDISIVWFSSPSEIFHTSMLILITHSEQSRITLYKKYMKILKTSG